MIKPIVSIIMPAYNASRTIAQSIDSVISQSFQGWELLIVDDYSTDDCFKIVLPYLESDVRIKLLQSPINVGVGRARNIGLDSALGDFIAFLDSDDLWLPSKLEKQLTFMLDNNYAFTYTPYRKFSLNPNFCGNLISPPACYTYNNLLGNTGIACLTVIINRKLTGPFHFYDVGHEDFALWLHLLKRGFVAHLLNKDLARYRVLGNSLSSNKVRSVFWVWNIYRNIEKLPLPKSCLLLTSYLFHAFIKRLLGRWFV